MKIKENPSTIKHPIFNRQLGDILGRNEDFIHVAMGCFWGAERIFWQLEGVTLTAVGYQGGTCEFPSYEEVCTNTTGHAETVRIVFDTTRLSLEQVLKTFWENHDPTTVDRQGNDIGSQYRSAVFATTPAQLEIASQIASTYDVELVKSGVGHLVTQLVHPNDAGRFWFAESHHQQYLFHNPAGYCMHGPNGVSCPMPPALKR